MDKQSPFISMRAFFGLLAISCLGLQPSLQADSVPSVSAFFADDSQEVFRLSPEGSSVAFLHFDGTASRLCTGNPENLKATTRTLTGKAEGSVFSFLWLGEKRLVFAARLPSGGTRIGCVRADPGKPGEITFLDRDENGVSLAGALSNGAAVLLSIPSPANPGIKDFYAADPVTGTRKLLHKNVEALPVSSVSMDGKTVVGIRCHSDGRKELLRIKEGQTKSLLLCSPEESLELVSMNPEGSLAFIVTNHGEEFARLEAVDLASGEMTVAGQDPEKSVDFNDAVFDRDATRLLGFRCYRDKSSYRWLSPEMENRFAMIKSLVPDGDVRIRDSSRDGNKWLVTVVKDTEPDAEYYFDVETRHLVRLDSKASPIPASCLGRMRAVNYMARDGQMISGYLTIPAGVAESNLPVVVFPHGGPNMRNYWGYDARVQFFASRGYAVFQPNFRGSSGYGKKFQNAGNGQWGRGVMQDDISDGVTWLVERGIADPRRVAIVGGSYGGFAVMAGLAFTPELYAAGVCLFGASDLPDFVRNVSAAWKPFLGDIFKKIGNPGLPEDERKLAWQSPVNFTGQIKAPVMVYHGAKDDLIQKSQADRFVSACRSSRVNVDYLVSATGAHGFTDPLDEQAVYIAIERFLARHIGGSRQMDVPPDVEERLAALRATAAGSLEKSSAGENCDSPSAANPIKTDLSKK